MYRKTYAEIDLNVLKNNVKDIIKNYKYKHYIAVVKANAYGHGDYIVNSLIESGINYLAASSLEECLSIRKHNKDIPILCLEPIDIRYLDIASQNNITITISDFEYFKKFKTDEILKVHLKINSGMNRLGISDKYEVLRIYKDIKERPNLFLEGVYTHFGTSGIWDKNWDNQFENFKNIISLIDLDSIPIIHIARSLSLINHPKPDFVNGARFGIVMYGFAQKMKEPTGLKLIKRKFILASKKISPTFLTNNLKVKPAMTLNTEVMSINYVKAGEFVGYGAKFIASENVLIGVLPIGYADGFSKNNEGRYVKINNKSYKIVGEIGMDMTTVLIDSDVKIGDKVVLYDDIPKVCREIKMNSYQLFTSITNRVPRVYIEDGKRTEIKY